MATKNKAVFGIYATVPAAEGAVDSLRSAGFRTEDISALLPDNQGTKDFAHEKGTKAPEGAVAGASTGLVIGGALGWLAGIGTLVIPGVGPLIAAGPILAMLTGVGVGGVVGGIAGALVGMGIPEYEAKRYEGRVRSGKVLVSIHCDDHNWVKKAKKIMTETGAEDISSVSEASADYAATEKPLKREQTV
jgi:hypothetical protein